MVQRGVNEVHMTQVNIHLEKKIFLTKKDPSWNPDSWVN